MKYNNEQHYCNNELRANFLSHAILWPWLILDAKLKVWGNKNLTVYHK